MRSLKCSRADARTPSNIAPIANGREASNAEARGLFAHPHGAGYLQAETLNGYLRCALEAAHICPGVAQLNGPALANRERAGSSIA
jgi:hypothetical protein